METSQPDSRAASAARLGQAGFLPGRCQWQHGAIPDGRASPDRPAIGRNFAVGLCVLDNGQSVLNADGVAQSTDGFCAAPKVAELPVTVQVERTQMI